jgi:hypothetical protein
MLTAHGELILIVTGLATAGALALVVAPVPMMKAVFGKSPADPLGLIMARHWALLVFLVGGLIVYAAFHAEIRVPTLIVAVVEKAAFAAAMLTSRLRWRSTVIVIALADAGMAALYLMFLAGL